MSISIYQFLRHCALTFAIVFIAGCASVQRAGGTFSSESTHWQGRLALKVSGTPPQSLSANFELDGNAQSGSLALSSVLGSTLALMQWSPGKATLRSGSETREFTSLNHMLQEVTGADIPADSLFDWLRGINTANPPWEADLSGLDQGRIIARRTGEPNPAELKVLLEP